MDSIFKKYGDYMAEIPAILQMLYILFLREYMHQIFLVAIFSIAMVLSYVGQLVARKKSITNKNVVVIGYVLSTILFITYICASFIPTFNHNIWKWMAYFIMALFYCLEIGNIHNQTSTRYVVLYLLTFFSFYVMCL